MASIKDFQALDLRVARIARVETVEGKDRLYKLALDAGDGRTLQTMSGIRPFYRPDELQGRLVVIVAGLEPAVIAGHRSETMLLAVKKEDGAYALLQVPDGVRPGTRVE